MSDRFYSDYFKHRVLVMRAPLPPNTGMVPKQFTQHTTTLALVDDTGAEYGTVTYYTGNVHSLQLPPLAANAPYLYQPVVQGNPALPRLLVITGFYSHLEHTMKGIGSAMLRELLAIADQADCRYIVVESGVNHEVYTALGFDLIHPVAETWCMPVSRLRARVSPLRRAREAP